MLGVETGGLLFLRSVGVEKIQKSSCKFKQRLRRLSRRPWTIRLFIFIKFGRLSSSH